MTPDKRGCDAMRCLFARQAGLKAILSSLCAGPHMMGDKNLSELDLSLNLNIALASARTVCTVLL